MFHESISLLRKTRLNRRLSRGGKVKLLLTGLMAYSVSFVILLVVLYSHERTKTGPLARCVPLIMTQMAALLALLRAAAYVLLTELLTRHRDPRKGGGHGFSTRVAGLLGHVRQCLPFLKIDRRQGHAANFVHHAGRAGGTATRPADTPLPQQRVGRGYRRRPSPERVAENAFALATDQLPWHQIAWALGTDTFLCATRYLLSNSLKTLPISGSSICVELLAS